MAITRTGAPASPASAARSSACSGVLRGRRGDQHDGPVAGRRGDALAPAAPTAAARRPAATAPSGAGTRAAAASPTSVSSRESPVWSPGSGASPSRARQSLYSSPALLEPLARRAGRTRATPAAERRARQPRADRVGREAGRRPRMHVRDQRGHGHAAELRGERRGGGEDVGDRDVGRERLDRRDGLPRGAHRGLVGLERPLARREHLVLGRGGERHPRRARGLLPAPPGLQRDGVAAGDERLAEREHGEGVARVAERAEVDAQAHSGLTYATIGSAEVGEPLRAAVVAPARGLVEAPRGRLARRPELRPRRSPAAPHRRPRRPRASRGDPLAPAVGMGEHGGDVRAAGDRLQGARAGRALAARPG